MTSFEVSTIIRKPVELVVAALMDPDNMPFWTKHLERFEVLKGTAGQAGALGRLHYIQNGRRYVMQDEMIEAEPGRRYLSRVSGDAIEALVETRLVPAGDQTKLTIRWSGRGLVVPLKWMLPFLRRQMVRQSKQELETFRSLVETRGSRFGEESPDPHRV